MGDSMAPTLVPGTVVMGVLPRKIRPGDVVIVRHGGLDKIKRIKELRAGEVFLLGDNPADSTDSRNFGWLESTVILAKVIWPRT